MAVTLNRSPFGVTRDGQAVERFRFQNDCSTSVDILSYGGVLASWRHADCHGQVDDIVLGYDSLQDYEACQIYMGCIAGRYANRIAHGRFTLDGKDYQLECNNNGHHLHGGNHGLHRVVWQGAIEDQEIPSNPVLVLNHRSEDMAGGYPGNLDLQVRFTLSDDNTLSIEYLATTDKATVINLTSHGYFNLNGAHQAVANGVTKHQLQVHGSAVLMTDDEGIPVGEPRSVCGSGFDFTAVAEIQGQLGRLHRLGQSGLDHCYVLAGGDQAALLYSPESGRCLSVSATAPGLQVYSAEHVNGCTGRAGIVYGQRGSICLEAQYFPDSPNRPDFPSTVLRPEQVWREKTSYRVWNR